MARIERKVHYVGTWRENLVTDGTMRQIIARSLAEKGQKVKIKLSKEGLVLSKTVLLQENLVSSQRLQDVYFLTVNQKHPCCLLCIVADPVRKYLILAMKTANSVEAQEIISTFKALKDNPTINSGNVVLRRKDNGNWTLRERSQHNANRHLQEVFATTDTPHTFHPNGTATGSHVPVIDGSKLANQHHPTNYRLVPEDEGKEDVVVVSRPHGDVEDLSEELQDVKFVVEKTGSVSQATLKRNTSHSKYPHHHHHHNNNNTIINNNNINNDDDEDDDKSYYIETEVVTTKPEPVLRDDVIEVYGHGDPDRDSQAGEVRVAVEDHREDGVVRAHSNGSAVPITPAVVVHNGGLHHPITLPEPKITTATYTSAGEPAPNPPLQAYSEIPAYQIQRRVSTEYVQVPDFGRKVSQTGSLRSTATLPSARVSFDPEVVLRGGHDPRKFRSLRTSRYLGTPTTVVRPIEEVYRGHPKASILRPHPAMYAAAPHHHAFLMPPQQALYMHGSTEVLAHPHHRRRRSRPSSIHVMEGNELRVFHKTGEADDILL